MNFEKYEANHFEEWIYKCRYKCQVITETYALTPTPDIVVSTFFGRQRTSTANLHMQVFVHNWILDTLVPL